MIAQQLKSIQGFRLVTADLGRLTRFYGDMLGFAVEGAVQPIAVGEMELLGLTGKGNRQILSIGGQSVTLDEFEVVGHPYPGDSDAVSLLFQYLAFVVVDIAEAYAMLLRYPWETAAPASRVRRCPCLQVSRSGGAST